MIGRARRWRRRLGAALRLDPAARWLAIETAAMLAAARILVLTTPLHRIAGRWSDDRGGPDVAGVVDRITRRLPAVARSLPFRAQCLEQALAVTMMLRRRRIRSTLHLGTTRGGPNGRGFEAHAWITVADVVIVGGPIDRYVELTRF